MTYIDELKELKVLQETGVITQDEYENKKKQLLEFSEQSVLNTTPDRKKRRVAIEAQNSTLNLFDGVRIYLDGQRVGILEFRSRMVSELFVDQEYKLSFRNDKVSESAEYILHPGTDDVCMTVFVYSKFMKKATIKVSVWENRPEMFDKS